MSATIYDLIAQQEREPVLTQRRHADHAVAQIDDVGFIPRHRINVL